MVDLVSALFPEAPARALPDRAALGEALDRLARRGAEAWPRLPLAGPQLVAQVARGLAAEDRTVAVLDGLHGPDVHLVAACAAGVPGALAAFDEVVLAGRAVGAALARLDPSPAFADEVRQLVREKLLVGSLPKLTGYSGRWPLQTWVRTIALRTAIDLQRAVGVAPPGAAEEQATEEASPELRVLKAAAGQAFKAAFAEAFRALDDEQCTLLRLAVVDGLRTAQIAALFRLDRSTVKRRLAATREQLLTATRARLMAELRLTPTEFESLAGLVESQLAASVARQLRTPTPTT